MRRVCAEGSVMQRMKASLAPPMATVLTTTTRMLARRTASPVGVLLAGSYSEYASAVVMLPRTRPPYHIVTASRNVNLNGGPPLANAGRRKKPWLFQFHSTAAGPLQGREAGLSWARRAGRTGWGGWGALVAAPEVDDSDGERDEERADEEDEDGERDREREDGAQELGIAIADVRAQLGAHVEAGVDEEEHLRHKAEYSEVVHCRRRGVSVAPGGHTVTQTQQPGGEGGCAPDMTRADALIECHV